MKIKTKDKIVQTVLRKMDERSLIGQKKYGATMMQEIEGQEKDLNRFLIDVQEELMDALLYIEAAKRCLTDEIEECMINREKKFNGPAKCGCGTTKNKEGYCDGSHEEAELISEEEFNKNISNIELDEEEL